MSAIDLALRHKEGEKYTTLESIIMAWKRNHPEDADAAADELLKLRDDLAETLTLLSFQRTEVERLQRVEVAASELHARMRAIYYSQEYWAVWHSWKIHHGDYKGENWTEEFDALTALLEGN